MQEFPIREYIHQIWKRRKIVGIFFLSVVILTALMTLRQPKIYRAVTVIEIGSESPDVGLFQDVVNMTPYYGWWSALKYYETQFAIIQSRSLLKKAAQNAIDQGIIRNRSVDSLTAHLQANLRIGSDEKSRLANIYFEDTDPGRAQKLANVIAKTYVDENLTQKLSGISDAVAWLNDRLVEIRIEKKEQERELQKYMEEHKIVSTEDRQHSTRANLVALTNTLNKLKSRRIENEAKYQKLRQLVRSTKIVGDLLGGVTSELLIKLKVDLAVLRANKTRMAQRYKEKHPDMVRVNVEIEGVELAIQQEVQNEVSRFKTKYLLVRAEEKSIAAALEQQKLETVRFDDLNRRLADIKVITDTNQKIFESLQKKIKEADLSALVRSNNIRIVDEALRPGSPIRPDLKTNLILAIIVGLLGGIGLALVLEYVDDTFKTQEDVERYLQVPLLGLIPRYPPPSKNGSTEKLEFVPAEKPTASISEFYRILRTNVLFLSATKGLKKLLMVSTGPGEGKTVTALNLAITLAQAGEKTILIDLDLRRPKLHHQFEGENQSGITSLLLKERTLQEIVQSSHIKNLDYIFSGPTPPNPAELLGAKELKNMLTELSSKYDRVIIDSSPIAPVTDAVVLAQEVDGIVMLVRAGKTHRKAALFAREQLRKVGVDILGAVLNDVDVERSTYANYQYYKYGYDSYLAEADEKEPPEDATVPPGIA